MEITIRIPDSIIKICNENGFDETKTKLVVSTFINQIMKDGYGQFKTDFSNFLNDEDFEKIIGEYDAETDNQYEAIIEKIQNVIKRWGGFTVADVDAGSSPIVNSLGDTVQLAEEFGYDKVSVITYVDEYENGSDYVSYNDLKYEVLEEIEWLADIWDTQNLLDEKRI